MTATPSEVLSELTVISSPAAAPAWWRETAFIAARLSGVIANPIPKPSITVGTQMSE